MKWSWPWKRERPASVRFSDLAWDVHSHLVPGVDDGAPDLDAALDMVRGMHALGYKGMVLTPHIMSDLYPNSPETLRPAFESLQSALKEARIPLKLELAAEYLLEPESLELLHSGELLTFTCADHAGNAKEVVLMEFGFHHAPNDDLVKEALFAAQTRGLTPSSPTASAIPTSTKRRACSRCGANAGAGCRSTRPRWPVPTGRRRARWPKSAWTAAGCRSCAPTRTACVT